MNKIKILTAFLFIGSLVLFSGCGCKEDSSKSYQLNLEVWGFLDDRENLNDIFAAYQSLNPHIRHIEYRKLSTDTYKQEIIDALASGQGPDVFLIHNTWLPGFRDKIVPAPAGIISEQKFKKEFIDVVAADFFSDGQAYAVPISVDSLALYYNKDLFNAAGITSPPKDWNDFVTDVIKLTRVNSFGEITQSGAALGTAYNINRSTDILNMLMMQGGTDMVDREFKRTTFDTVASVGDNAFSAGENALNFYTQFARTNSSNYSWNSRLHYSIDAFSEGTLAMMFNYSWHIDTIRNKSPKLNFTVAAVPQFPGADPANYANYWAFAVAKNTIPKVDTGLGTNAKPVSNDTRVMEAWNLLRFMTMKPDKPIVLENNVVARDQMAGGSFDPAMSYLTKSRRPAARRDLIEQQLNDPELGVFAKDNLIAKSWYQTNPENFEATFATMIDDVNRGQSSVRDAIDVAAMRINQMLK